MASTVITLPDGSKCYSGPDCKRHGVVAQQVELKKKINEVLKPAKETKAEKARRWEEEYQAYRKKKHEKDYTETFDKLKTFGLIAGERPDYLPAKDKGYVAIKVDNADTVLFVGDDGKRSFPTQEAKAYCRAWLVKDGKPVAMLRFATYPEDYIPSADYPYAESVICDIEVREGHSGKGYGLETIRHVEKNVLGGRLIHSGGSYTPEGHKALGGKLPYTHEATYFNKEIKEGKIPAPRFSSMRFVEDWDNLNPLH